MSDKPIKIAGGVFIVASLVFIPVFHRIVDRMSIVALIFDQYYRVKFRD